MEINDNVKKILVRAFVAGGMAFFGHLSTIDNILENWQMIFVAGFVGFALAFFGSLQTSLNQSKGTARKRLTGFKSWAQHL